MYFYDIIAFILLHLFLLDLHLQCISTDFFNIQFHSAFLFKFTAHSCGLTRSSGGGGGKLLDESSGQAQEDSSVRGLLRTYRAGTPLILLADNNYALFPYQLEDEWMYVVLGAYRIVDAWGEQPNDRNNKLSWLIIHS